MIDFLFNHVELVIVASNWILCLLLSWIYVLWLWLISGDIKFEGVILWRYVVPVFRFRLISRKSWYAKLWSKFYGFGGLLFAIIHRDEIGEYDDAHVESTIVHEIRHVLQVLILGTLFWISYGVIFASIKVFTQKHPYRSHPYEIDARASTDRWEEKGRPRIYAFGSRR